MLHTGTFKDIDPNKYDEIWLIVRSLRRMPDNPKGNIKHVPTLSPSLNLFYEYNNLRNRGCWNANAFETGYKPKFLQEMKGYSQQNMLKELAQKSKTKDILIVCFCENENMCHRSLVAKLVRDMQK